MIRATGILDTSALVFANWLWDYSRRTLGGGANLGASETGLYFLHPAKQEFCLAINHPGEITMDASWVASESGNIYQGAGIRFKLVPLSAERVEVIADCVNDAFAGYFQELADEINRRWPPKGDQPTPLTSMGEVGARLGGRPRDPDYDWAYEQIQVHGRGQMDVFREWSHRVGDRAWDLAGPLDSFKKAMKNRKDKERKGE
jgi:hypothetical protein